MSIIKDFKAFVMRGNVVDLAVEPVAPTVVLAGERATGAR